MVSGQLERAHGIKCNKLNDPVMINLLNSSDCIGLRKTRAEKSVDISLPGYHVFRKDRAKHKMPANHQVV